MKSNQNLVLAGIDEVGKGCLFGPVYASAVILKVKSKEKLISAGLKDSKLLSAKKREALMPIIYQESQSWGIGQASAREIDLFGIRSATELAMIRALKKLSIKVDFLLVDGILPLRNWPGEQETLVKGESKSAEIAAASVLAKESRDALIKRLAKKFPGYGLEKNMGYGTAQHRKEIIIQGITPLHRKSFLKKLLN